jgi:hypothetical protein
MKFGDFLSTTFAGRKRQLQFYSVHFDWIGLEQRYSTFFFFRATSDVISHQLSTPTVVG